MSRTFSGLVRERIRLFFRHLEGVERLACVVPQIQKPEPDAVLRPRLHDESVKRERREVAVDGAQRHLQLRCDLL